MEFGLQLYTLRDYLTTKEDVAQTFKKVAEMGYKTVQISGLKHCDIQQIKALCKEYDLKVVGAHMSFIRFLDEFDQLMEEYAPLHSPTLGVGSVSDRYEHSAQGFKRFAEDAAKISEKMKPYNSKFTYHNHAFEFQRYDGDIGYDILINETKGADNFTFCYDTYWAQVGGVDVCEYIEKLKGRLPLLHLKDYKLIGWQESTMCEIGIGTLNWKKIVDTMVKTNPDGYMVVEQDKCDDNALDSIKISIDYLKKNFGSL